MSSVRHPTKSVEEVLRDDTEIHRLSGGDIAFAIETNGEQSQVTIATNDARAIITVYEPGVAATDAIEAAYEGKRGLDRLLTAPFGSVTGE